jgi:RHS repeat-associated protein
VNLPNQIQTTPRTMYPFGMHMPGRSFSSGSYRYGFNGFEGDNEISGQGNSYTTLYRQYEPRLGRWKSLDPAMVKYPNLSPYVAFINNPVFYTDPFGNDPPEEDGTKEGEYYQYSFTYTSNEEGEKTTVTTDYYWHQGSENTKAGWYTAGSYAELQPVRNAVLDIAEQLGVVDKMTAAAQMRSFQGNLEKLENAGGIDVIGFEKFLKSEEANEIISDFNIRYSGSGRIDPVDYDFEILLMAYGGVAAIESILNRVGAKGGIKAIQAGKYTLTNKVAQGLATRPYINSPSTITNIMKSGKGIADKFFKGGVNYKVPGTFQGYKGIFELGINPETNTIYHFLFKTVK